MASTSWRLLHVCSSMGLAGVRWRAHLLLNTSVFRADDVLVQRNVSTDPCPVDIPRLSFLQMCSLTPVRLFPNQFGSYMEPAMAPTCWSEGPGPLPGKLHSVFPSSLAVRQVNSRQSPPLLCRESEIGCDLHPYGRPLRLGSFIIAENNTSFF